MTHWNTRRVSPDLKARYSREHTGRITPFDIVLGNSITLDGSPWNALMRLRAAPGSDLLASFEQEPRLYGASVPHAVGKAELAALSPSEVCERYRALY